MKLLVAFAHSLLFFGYVRVGVADRLVKRDQTYSTSVRDSTYDANFGVSGTLTTVLAGVTRWLSGGSTHNFFGNINNNGAIIISQTDFLKTTPGAGGQTCDYAGNTATNGNLNNTGSISLNDYGSASAPTYDWDLGGFYNYGSLQMCGRGDTGGSTYHLYCYNTCYNYGTIDMEQYNSNLGGAFFWRNANLYPNGATVQTNVYNYGAFRILNVVFHNQQNILGTGCWVIDTGATLYLEDGSGAFQNPGYGPTFPNQQIYMTGSTSTLHMDTQVYSHNSAFGPQVYGFGNGNAIEFYEIFRSSNPVTYSATAGTLTITFTSGNSVIIKIGTGYTASGFTTGAHKSFYNTGGYNAVFYNAAPPAQTVPTTCQVSLGVCQNPENTAGALGTGTTSAAATSTAATTATGYVTITATASGSIVGSQTLTIANPSGTNPGTVEIVPITASYNTITDNPTGTGSVIGTITTTIVQASGTVPGTVELIPIQGSYVTITDPTTGPAVGTRTTTIAQPSGTTPGTVELVPVYASYVTITGIDPTLTAPVTTTLVQPSGTNPGTIEVFQTPAYITFTRSQSGSQSVTGSTTYTVLPPSGTNPGVVEVDPLYAAATSTTGATGTSTTTSRPNPLATMIGPASCICVPA